MGQTQEFSLSNQNHRELLTSVLTTNAVVYLAACMLLDQIKGQWTHFETLIIKLIHNALISMIIQVNLSMKRNKYGGVILYTLSCLLVQFLFDYQVDAVILFSTIIQALLIALAMMWRQNAKFRAMMSQSHKKERFIYNKLPMTSGLLLGFDENNVEILHAKNFGRVRAGQQIKFSRMQQTFQDSTKLPKYGDICLWEVIQRLMQIRLCRDNTERLQLTQSLQNEMRREVDFAVNDKIIMPDGSRQTVNCQFNERIRMVLIQFCQDSDHEERIEQLLRDNNELQADLKQARSQIVTLGSLTASHASLNIEIHPEKKTFETVGTQSEVNINKGQATKCYLTSTNSQLRLGSQIDEQSQGSQDYAFQSESDDGSAIGNPDKQSFSNLVQNQKNKRYAYNSKDDVVLEMVCDETESQIKPIKNIYKKRTMTSNEMEQEIFNVQSLDIDKEEDDEKEEEKRITELVPNSNSSIYPKNEVSFHRNIPISSINETHGMIKSYQSQPLAKLAEIRSTKTAKESEKSQRHPRGQQKLVSLKKKKISSKTLNFLVENSRVANEIISPENKKYIQIIGQKSKEDIEQLQRMVNSTRIFLNMVIHDLRNPTNSIHFGIEESLSLITIQFDQIDEAKECLKELLNSSVQNHQSHNQSNSVAFNQSSSLKSQQSCFIINRNPRIGSMLDNHSQKERESVMAALNQSQPLCNDSLISDYLKDNLNGEQMNGIKAIEQKYLSKIASLEEQIMSLRSQHLIEERKSDEREQDMHDFADEDIDENAVIMKDHVVRPHAYNKSKMAEDKEDPNVIHNYVAYNPVVLSADKGTQCDLMEERCLSIEPRESSHQGNLVLEEIKQQEIASYNQGIRSKKSKFFENAEMIDDCSKSNESLDKNSIEVKSLHQMGKSDRQLSLKKPKMIGRLDQKDSGQFSSILQSSKLYHSVGFNPICNSKACNCNCHSSQNQGETIVVSKQMLQNMYKLLDSDAVKLVKKFLKQAQFSSMMLNNLINDLLDLAKFETNNFSFSEKFFDLIELVQNAINQLSFQAGQKDIKMTKQVLNMDGEEIQGIGGAEEQVSDFHIDLSFQDINVQNLLMNIYGDQARYLQIIVNFLSNAVKFTKKGGTIKVRVSIKECQIKRTQEQRQMLREQLQKSQESSLSQVGKRRLCLKDQLSDQIEEVFVKLLIEVEDSGVGIKKENLSKLFMDFGRLDEHSQMNSQGTGLGLSICKRMIERMGGKVTVDSEVDVGTTFRVELSTRAKFTGHQWSFLRSKKNSDAQKKFLTFNQSLNRSNPNLIDDLDSDKGFVNAKESHSSKFEIVEQSKHRADSSIEEIKEQLYSNNYCSEEDSFIEIQRQADIHFNITKSKNKLKVLVANDDEFQLLAVNHNLKRFENLNVTETSNGMEAYQQVITRDQTDLFDIILLDLDMPIMNGYEACKKIFEFFDPSNKLFGVLKSKTDMNNMENFKQLEIQNRKDHHMQQVASNRLDQQIKGKFKKNRSIQVNIDQVPKSQNKMDEISSSLNAASQSVRGQINESSIEKNLSSSAQGQTEQIKFKMPMIFAYSGFVNEQIRQDAFDAGFLDIIEAPLSEDKIMNSILKKYYEVQDILNHIDNEHLPLVCSINSNSVISRSLLNEIQSSKGQLSSRKDEVISYKNSINLQSCLSENLQFAVEVGSKSSSMQKSERIRKLNSQIKEMDESQEQDSCIQQRLKDIKDIQIIQERIDPKSSFVKQLIVQQVSQNSLNNNNNYNNDSSSVSGSQSSGRHEFMEMKKSHHKSLSQFNRESEPLEESKNSINEK